MLRYSPIASAAKSASFDISRKILILERKSFVEFIWEPLFLHYRLKMDV